MNTNHPVLALTVELCKRRSLTPDDAGCQELISNRLRALGFQIEQIDFGLVKNLWAWHGSNGPVLAFLGHTDVVPTGELSGWKTDPFVPELHGGMLYARGAADMKGSVAAMVVALEHYVRANPNHAGIVGILLTSDEEGDAIDGVRKVAEEFVRRNQVIDYCIVGEPSSKHKLGDLIRIGRRGSLSAKLRVRGVQGHVAYPERALNPIHQFGPALTELCAERWDEGNESFPPSTFQFSNIRSGTGANNVIPGHLECEFNFRFGTASSAEDLMRRSEAILVKHNLDYRIDWHLSGAPFLTKEGKLRQIALDVLLEVCGELPEMSTGGGTSDGRFIAPMGAQVIELGPINASIHKVDEHVRAADLQPLAMIYQRMIEKLFG